jgi:cytidine deaminase
MELAPLTISRLIEAAREAQRHAHAPYSSFPVGAALLAEDGRIFTGCNVENGSYGLTICAERNAVGAMVVAGARPVAVAVVANRAGVTPCGACRQVLSEFAEDMPVVLASSSGDGHQITSLATLLPGAFRFDQE